MASGIYVIRNVHTGSVYVGSAVHIANRWRLHRRQLNDRTHANRHLLRAWYKYGDSSFAFEVVEECSRSQLLDRENFWMASLGATDPSRGYNINPVAGSRLGIAHSEATRARMSASHKGRTKSAEHQDRITAALKGRRLSDDHRRKLSERRQGTVASQEARENMKKAQALRTMSTESRERMVTANVGKKFSDEHRQKIAEGVRRYRTRLADAPPKA